MVDAGRMPFPAQDADLGGLSGAPVFAWTPRTYTLVGLLSEASESLPLWRITSLAGVPADIDGLPAAPI
jgi:hypothetical protein